MFSSCAIFAFHSLLIREHIVSVHVTWNWNMLHKWILLGPTWLGSGQTEGKVNKLSRQPNKHSLHIFCSPSSSEKSMCRSIVRAAYYYSCVRCILVRRRLPVAVFIVSAGKEEVVQSSIKNYKFATWTFYYLTQSWRQNSIHVIILRFSVSLLVRGWWLYKMISKALRFVWLMVSCS